MDNARISKNFMRSEYACKCGCGLDTVDIHTAAIVQHVRDHFGVAFKINSGCRCPSWNKKIGGASKSLHMECRAADIRSVSGEIDPEDIASFILYEYPWASVGIYNTFVHVDTRTGIPWHGDKRT